MARLPQRYRLSDKLVSMRTVQGILFDLDGVIYDGETPIPGATATVDWARERKIPFLFVTNTTSRPRSAIVDKLDRMGVQAAEDDIWTPAAAATLWLQSHAAEPAALFVPGATTAEFEEVATCDPRAEAGAKSVVVGDLGDAWDFATLNRAFRLLHSDPSATLVALGMTRYWMSPTGPSLDVAPFVAALGHAASRQPVVLGKPAQPFFEAAAAKIGWNAVDLLMIGDDIRADVGGAQAAGMQGALVKTGKFKPGDLEGDIRPDLVLESVAELPDRWTNLRG